MRRWTIEPRVRSAGSCARLQAYVRWLEGAGFAFYPSGSSGPMLHNRPCLESAAIRLGQACLYWDTYK